MHTFFPKVSQEKLESLARWAKLRQDQLRDAITITSDTVTDFLMRQLERGNWKAVQEVLKGKPMTKAGKFLLAELRNNLASKLILRLGMRKVVAVGFAMVLLPLILAKVAGHIMYKVRPPENTSQ